MRGETGLVPDPGTNTNAMNGLQIDSQCLLSRDFSPDSHESNEASGQSDRPLVHHAPWSVELQTPLAWHQW